MILGINWTLPSEAGLMQTLIKNKEINLVEILIDNFIHFNPGSVRKIIGDIPVSLHIMNSRFLSRKEEDRNRLSQLLRKWFYELDPLYVSDHLGLFEMEGNTLPLMVEVDYVSMETNLIQKIEEWQNLLDVALFLENYPSYTSYGNFQLSFFKNLEKKTGVLPLMDISNALVAQKNVGFSAQNWIDLSLKTNHFHCGGFRKFSGLYLDSHDCTLSREIVDLIHFFLKDRVTNTSLIIERDHNKNYPDWLKDKSKI